VNQAEWKQLRKELEPQQSGWPTLLVMAVDLVALAFSLWLQGRAGPWNLAGVFVLTLVLLHGYLWLHEASHSSICRNQTLNDLVGHLAGWLIVMPYLSRRRSHLLHHTWTGHPTGDPANKRMIERFSVMTPKQAQALESVWRSWIPLFALNDRVGLWRDAPEERRRGVKTKQIEREIRANRAYVVAYACLVVALLATGKLASFASWYLPAFLALLFLEELVNAPHHAETPLLGVNDEPLPFWEQHRVTHSCRRAAVWSPFVLLNFNLHVAHHFFPRIPWSGLPAAQRELARRIPELERQTTASELAWSLRSRKVPLLTLMGHYFNRVPPTKLPSLVPPAKLPSLVPPARPPSLIPPALQAKRPSLAPPPQA
jgi:fatty acid desaturase